MRHRRVLAGALVALAAVASSARSVAAQPSGFEVLGSIFVAIYEIEVEEVEGSGDMAYLRGRGSLTFTYQDAGGEVSHLTSRAVHLSVAQRTEDGTWRITRRSWSAIR